VRFSDIEGLPNRPLQRSRSHVLTTSFRTVSQGSPKRELRGLSVYAASCRACLTSTRPRWRVEKAVLSEAADYLWTRPTWFATYTRSQARRAGERLTAL
jgi:hypothetical protein